MGRFNAGADTWEGTVTALRTRWSAYLDQQHRYPTGWIGQLIGEQMLRQHAPETTWSIDILHLQPTDRFLEIGFGAGRGLSLALEQCPRGQVIGVDVSPTMLAVVARRYRAARARGQLALLRGDVAALPLLGQQINKIVSVHTFYFWPEPHTILLQLVALLAPHGRLVTTFATAHTSRTGTRTYWPLHAQAEALVQTLQHQPGIRTALACGPNSRQFNNLAIVIDKA